MKNIYIGDTHGRTDWRQIVEDNQDADNIVFIGDYFDSFDVPGIRQLNNAIDIVNYKRLIESTTDRKVYLLIGNHDHHYMPGVKHKGSMSGFQPTMAFQFEQFFRENEDMFQMCVMIGNVLCTHAGVSATFLRDTGFTSREDTSSKYIPDFLNDLFKYKPNEFGFNAYTDRHYGLAYADSYGDNEGQSPIWIRPKSLQSSNKSEGLKKEVIQVVGHTQVETIDIKGRSTGGKYYYIDALHNGQYLIEENGEFKIGKI
jgi:hypothetical protein